MPQNDPAERDRTLMERKLTEANEIVNTTSGKVLPILILTLTVAWFLGLETQITPLFLKATEPKKALMAFQDEIRASKERRIELQKEIRAAESKFEKEGGNLDRINEPRSEGGNTLPASLKASYTNLRKMQEKEEELQKNWRVLQAKVSDSLKVVEEQKVKAESVEFKLPILELKVPRIAAPLVWCIVAVGTVLYILHVRRRVGRLVAEAVMLGRRSGISDSHFEHEIAHERWWLHPYPKSEVSVVWPPYPLSLTIRIFWVVSGLACLRMVCLGHHSLVFEEQGWAPGLFFLLSTGSSGVILSLIAHWAQMPPVETTRFDGRVDTHRRQFLHVCAGFGLGAIFGGIILWFLRPTPISTVVAQIAALRGKPNRSSKFSACRRRHTANPPPLPGETANTNDDDGDTSAPRKRPSGMFVQNAKGTTVHYIFPREAYGENRPKKFRSRGPRTLRPNPDPTGIFIRWGKAPVQWGAIMAEPANLLLVKPEQFHEIPRVALKAAASSFEHLILQDAVPDGDLDRAIKLGLAAIRHDLLYIEEPVKGLPRPNFRIYDLTAGLMVRVGNRDSIVQLAKLIQESSRRTLFADRIAKWLQPDNRWSTAWQKKVAVNWANCLISSNLLK